MTSAAFDRVSALDENLHRRGDPMSTRDFLAVLHEVSGLASEPLTASERAFLLEHTDLREEDLTEEARAATSTAVATEQLLADEAVQDRALSTGEVAKLLGRAEANVRRSRLRGDLYAPGAGSANRPLRFPAWQFTEEGDVVPDLRRVVSAFPRFFHPLSVERFMTAPHEALEGLSPVRWLTRGGDSEPVIGLVEELGHE